MRQFSLKLLAALLVALSILTAANATEHEITIPTEWGRLVGTLYKPEQPNGVAVIIIAGSGPTDRYGNSTAGVNTQAYALLAKELCSEGYATLSYDKRGIAASYYNDSEQMIRDCRFEYYVDDAILWVEHLKGLGFHSVVLIGHSEGALISLIAAERSRDVSGVISLSGAGYPIDQILKKQLIAQLIAYDYSLYAEANKILNSLKRGEEPSEIPTELATLFPRYLNRFYTEQMSYNPASLARSITQPLLIIGGDRDLQVTPDNAQELKRGAQNAQLIIIPRMTHTLKLSDGNSIQEQMAAYTNPALPLPELLTKSIVEFLMKF